MHENPGGHGPLPPDADAHGQDKAGLGGLCTSKWIFF